MNWPASVLSLGAVFLLANPAVSDPTLTSAAREAFLKRVEAAIDPGCVGRVDRKRLAVQTPSLLKLRFRIRDNNARRPARPWRNPSVLNERYAAR